MKIWTLLVSILVLASILRFWSLDKVPPGLFGDELDVGYQAYSLLMSGKDYYGQTLPTYIHSFSEWRAPLLMYVTAPFIGVFGLNEWGVRLPEAFFGVVSVLLVFFLVREISKNDRIALFSSLLLAVSPWHLQYSRAAFEASLLLLLLLGGSLFFLYGLKKRLYLICSSVLFALTLYTYNTANIFTTFFVLFLIVSNWKRLGVRKVLAPGIVAAFIALPIVYQIFFGLAAERFNKFSLLADEEIMRQIVTQRLEGGNTFVEKILHNRPIEIGKKFLSNYAISFSPQFLFIDGDVTFRHSIHYVGEFYWIELVFILFGLYTILKKGGNSKFWLVWLLIAPIPAALTWDGSIHATRLILMLPPLIYLAATGLNSLFDVHLLRRAIPVLVTILLFAEVFNYLHRYWVQYPQESWRWWHTGYKEAMLFMKDKEDNYKTIVFNNTYEPSLIRFLFWWQYSPKEFLSEFTIDKPQQNILAGFDGFKLGEKYYFGAVSGSGVQNFVDPGMLYLVSQRDEVPGDWDWEKSPPAGIKVLKTVRNPYGEPIFYVVTKS